MANGKRMLRLGAAAIVLAVMLCFQMEAMGMFDSSSGATTRPDVIKIDTIAKLETLEQPAAVFMHDAHTKALKDQGMSCTACHKKDSKGKMALTFNRVEEDGQPALSADELKAVYHDGCITCHVKSADKGYKSGPKAGECRGCHQERPSTPVARAEAGMDHTLHAMHWNSKELKADAGEQTNCGACHHIYDEAAKKTVYVKDKEESCRACHTETPAKPVTLDKEAAFHAQCVTCHQSMIDKKAAKTGPVTCGGCHGEKGVAARKDAEAKALAAMGGKLPRLPRKQPDAVLMTIKPLEKDAKSTGMAPVAFDHKFHETQTDTCRACHHKSVQACSSCHTPLGVEKGGYVTIGQAMHDLKNKRSCVGCHAEQQKKPECAGCHDLRPKDKGLSQTACKTCHNAPAKDSQGMLMAMAPKETRTEAAEAVVASRPGHQARVAVDAIPEFVKIGALANEYQASTMPHRKIVLKLYDGMKDSGLAANFHSVPEAMCQGCHHNAPASLNPPSCASCHAKPFTREDEGRPGLKAAYHGQCMGCHKSMGIEKPAATNCVGCHAKKAN
ncbi:sulfate respiration complex hexadecaheme cytochrome HmcA [Pseudodesulfovibrio sp.]|uniref:sulfate respiration complex hexadecaheme cytochrome HmcA n=1 Tax=unclassified Pseudodesulfovibrio TaxID=2661612 RepID=UPI003AFFA594